MLIQPGGTLSHYRLTEKIGEGGMGVVWKAQDTKLGREVAIKLLPEQLTADAERLARLEREAKVLASLNHPNIAAIYDLDRDGDHHFLVLELVEGEDLAERMSSGVLPTAEAVRLAVQIAGALEAAHESQIIHRDLKPANIMLTSDGRIKVLDFGLAKVWEGVPADSALTFSPTITAGMTQAGVILGTAAYMSPEQARGQTIDKRSDIWAFGVLLYEMLTGDRLFAGDTATDILGAIVHCRPDWDRLPGDAPAGVVRLLKRCLTQELSERLRDIGEARYALSHLDDEAAEAAAETAPPPATSRTWKIAAGLSLAVTFAMVAILAMAYFGRPAPQAPSLKMHVLPPEDALFRSSGAGAGPVRISPDGRHLAFVAQTSLGEPILWVRSLDALQPRPLKGTERAKRHFWSADSRWLGFFTGGKLKKIDIAGGPALSLCDAANGRNGSWSKAGVILFAPDSTHPIHRVPAAGGESTPVTELLKDPREETHRFPEFLPDGEHFLFLARSAGVNTEGPSTTIYARSLDSPERTVLLRGTSNALYASGHLLFVRETTLMARPFDADALAFTGDAFPVAESVQFDTGFSRAVFSASENGVLAYQSGVALRDSQLKWFDRNGSELAAVAQPGNHSIPALSPDGKRAAVTMVDADSGNWDLWLYELERGIRTRFTFNTAVDALPVWSPDGSRIVFASNRNGIFDLFQKTASGAGTVDPLYESEREAFPYGWSPDGRYLMLEENREGTKNDILYLDMQGEAEPRLYLSTEFDELHGRFSPDGRWVAFMSEESGKKEIYVAAFPEPAGKWQVSIAGGDEPHWAPDGTELFYLSSNNDLMAAEVSGEGDSFGVGRVQVLFRTDSPNEYGWNFSVGTDGQRFLVNTLLESNTLSPIVVVSDWRPKEG